MSTELQILPLSRFVLSQTPVQIERRSQFDQAALKELAATIKAAGRCEQAIIARPLLDKLGRRQPVQELEIVDGERRYIGTQIAGLTEIRAEIRELTDEQVEQIQIITGLQKEGLHELVEAEGYESLLKRGHTAEDIAAKCGKSKGTVYARMKLLALSPEGRKAFREGKISASIALLIARIPVEDLQKKALEHILNGHPWRDEPMSYREAAEYVHKEFTLRLSEAPFPRDDADLVSGAGTCGACPKRTGNQPELFGDIKGADVCTDPKCFSAKRSAWNKLQVAKAKDTGKPVITGAEAKKISRRSYYSSDAPSLSGGYVRPADKCPEDPKRRTYAELLGKGAEGVLLQNPDTGAFSKAYKREDIAATLKDKHKITLKKDAAPDQGARRDTAEIEAKAKREGKFRHAVFRAVLAAAPPKLGRTELEAIALSLFRTGHGDDEDIYEALGWPVNAKRTLFGEASAKVFIKRLGDLSDTEVSRLVYALTVIEDAISDYGKADDLLATAKHLKVDVDKIRQELEAAEKKPAAAAKPAPAKASKKKAARKAK